MEISEVNIVPIKPNDGLIAFASVVVGNCLYLGSLGVHSRLDGTYRITYPTKRLKDKELTLYHPINRELGYKIEEAVAIKCQQIFEGSDENDRYNKNSYKNAESTSLQR